MALRVCFALGSVLGIGFRVQGLGLPFIQHQPVKGSTLLPKSAELPKLKGFQTPSPTLQTAEPRHFESSCLSD